MLVAMVGIGSLCTSSVLSLWGVSRGFGLPLAGLWPSAESSGDCWDVGGLSGDRAGVGRPGRPMATPGAIDARPLNSSNAVPKVRKAVVYDRLFWVHSIGNAGSVDGPRPCLPFWVSSVAAGVG
jgi:hypothetical protein